MNTMEKWICEYQEQITFLTDIEYYKTLKDIADKENIPLTIAGYINNSKFLKVETKHESITPVNLPYKECEIKTFNIKKPPLEIYNKSRINNES